MKKKLVNKAIYLIMKMKSTNENLNLSTKTWRQKELLSEEFKSLGFYISDHPLNEL